MKKLFHLLILLSCCCLSFGICIKDDEVLYQESLNENDKDMPAFTQFTLDFLLKSIQQNGNIVCSPISVHNIFTLLAHGVEGKSLKKMELMLEDNIDSLYEYYKDHFKDYQLKGLTFSNLLWLNENLILSDLFLDQCNGFPLTQVKNIDFSNEKAKDIINEWIAGCTNHTIKNMIERVQSQDKLIATSTLYFTSNWAFPFLKENNIIDKFFSSEGHTTQVEYMRKLSNYQYFDDKKSTILILPYEKSDLSFFLILPKRHILLKDYIRTISGADVANLLQNRQKNYKTVNLYLPKFKIEYSNDLKNVFAEMEFNPININFSNILKDGGDVYLRNFYQKTFFSIDENGTEAASATLTYIDSGRIKDSKPIELKFNRPFIFGIIENKSNIPLFIGAINEL